MSRSEAVLLPLMLGYEVAKQERGITFIGDWHVNADVHTRRHRFRIKADVADNSEIPSVSEWYVLVDASYPWGEIAVHPAEGGISTTYWHQLDNRADPSGKYVKGNICTSEAGIIRKRLQISSREPLDSEKRLAWHVRRARLWLEMADRSELAVDGDPFELPHFPSPQAPVVAFSEDTRSYTVWRDETKTWGIVDVQQISNSPESAILVRRFLDVDGSEIHLPSWGAILEPGSEARRFSGYWILLDRIPVLPPYQVPHTWGELYDTLGNSLARVEDAVSAIADRMRPNSPALLLFGYPIPRRYGDSPFLIQWQAARLPDFKLPPLNPGVAKAFGERELRRRIRQKLFGTDSNIDWTNTENWSRDEVTARGAFESDLTNTRIAILGAGALGSALAEILVRCGSVNIDILDRELLEGGNLVRHVLCVSDIGRSKAESLAARLNSVNVHANVRGHGINFRIGEPNSVEILQGADVIIDCTADDLVIAEMEQLSLDEEKLFISLSLGYEAERLLGFAATGQRFPSSLYRQWVRPYILDAHRRIEQAGLPRQTGCWHPLFPARWDYVLSLAGFVVNTIEKWMADPPSSPSAVVLERTDTGISVTHLEVVTST